MQWHADSSSWMRVTEFTTAMPVESSTRPAEYQRADRDDHRSSSLSETKASYRESQVTSQGKAWMDRCKGRNDFARRKLGERLLSAPAKTVQGRSTYTSCWKDRAKRSLYALVHTEHSATYGLPGTCIRRFLPSNNLADVNLR